MAEHEQKLPPADGNEDRHSEFVVPAMDAEGTITAAFVEAVAAAVESGDAPHIRELAGDLHAADLGTLVEALSPDARPKLIELMGADFDFAALTEVDVNIREDI